MPANPLFTAYPLQDYKIRETEITSALQTALQGGYYILGGEVGGFEKEFAAWCGAEHGIGVANGTDAIELLLRGLGVGPGDAVAVPSHTAVASVSAITRAGAMPVYLDIDPATCTICPASLEAAWALPVGPLIKAVLAVHLYGHPCDMDGLSAICRDRGIALLEDCAQAHGAAYHGKRVGGLAQGAAFSFYPTKNLGAIGDGGAITTNDSALAERIRELRQYGWRERYISAIEGVNSRLDELQAAILRVKLRSLDEMQQSRGRLAARLTSALSGLPEVQVPTVAENCVHAYHLYVIRTKAERRDALLNHLIAGGVPAALHYPAAVHQQPGYARYADHSPPLTQTEALIPEILSLPLHPHLSDAAIDYTVEAVRAFFDNPPASSD